MRFPPEFIERLRHHSPISQVIGKRVAVKRHGREFHALCPFHKEKSPSFTINDEKSFFHCFGCGAHGDAIGFVKDFEGISYTEAVERLAAELGLQVPQMTRESREYEQKRHTIEDALSLAAAWFAGQLSTQSGREARDYINERGLSGEIIERFGIGYAPAGRDEMKVALIKQGISETMLIEAGLLAKSDDGRTYDRFRGRLIFPIRNSRGVVVAFGGRILPSAQPRNVAKYLNSPETMLFKKGEMLFGYDMASRESRNAGNIIVAEGYMDVIALHQAGFSTAVAPLGTAITEAQLKLLWRAVAEPVICLDGDSAGARAMKRVADLALPLLKPGFSLKFVTLPKGEDPDSLIKKSGAAAMRQAIAGARVLSRVLWENAIADFGMETVESKSSLEQYLINTAEKVADNIVKQHMRDYFREQIFSIKRKKKGDKKFVPNVQPGVLPDENDTELHLTKLEERVIAVVVLYPYILHHSDIEEHFAHMDFTQAVLDKIRSAVLEISSAVHSVGHAGLCAALAERGFSEKVDTLLYSNNSFQVGMRNEVAEEPEFVMRMFESAYSAYTDKKLEYEIKEAASAFERDMSEQNQNRLFSLKKQREEWHNSRYVVVPDE